MPDNEHWATFYRFESEYLIRFIDLADFILTKDGLNIVAYPVPGVSNQTIDHLHLNLIVPLALSCQFKLVLHGSAVQIDNIAVAFLGMSGSGKSTLAASFSTNGHQFLSDDCLLLNDVKSQYFVQPSHSSIRLWDDSRGALIPDTVNCAPLVDYTPKAQLLADKKVAFCNKELPLRCIYFLNSNNTDDISIRPISGSEVIIELEKHSFLLDMEEKEMLTNHFQKISRLAKNQIFFQLNYPRCYDRLPEVRSAIVNHAKIAGSLRT